MQYICREFFQQIHLRWRQNFAIKFTSGGPHVQRDPSRPEPSGDLLPRGYPTSNFRRGWNAIHRSEKFHRRFSGSADSDGGL